ncbi:Peptidase family S41 [Ruminococcaceae bacterium FB2012]|nr:Peptidase family S41 [Ruminococcaceae bacterium FB2012]
MKHRIIAAAAAVTAAAAAIPAQAFALDEGFEKKNVTAYLYSMDKSEELECLFSRELPEVPYVSMEDFLDRIYTVDFTTAFEGNVYTVTGNNMTVTVDADRDTVSIQGFDSNYDINTVPDEAEQENDGDHVRIQSIRVISEGSNTDYGLSEYDIDLIGDDGKIYFPLATLSDMFDSTYNGAEFIGGSIFFVHTLGVVDDEDGYMDRSPVFEETRRSQAMADYTYNEFCFLVDNLYGCPSRAKISGSVIEKGLDKTLDEYSDDTREVKKLLRSTDRIEFLTGLLVLDNLFNDGGHTVLPAFMGEDKYSSSPLLSAFSASMNDEGNPYMEQITDALIAIQNSDLIRDGVGKLRAQKYAALEQVKKWDGEAGSSFYTHGDTAYFIFDTFLQPDVLEQFKWSLDYAAEKGLRNFVIDLSCNGGGDEFVVHYISSMIGRKAGKSNNYSISMKSRRSGTVIARDTVIDLNLDGVIDGKDKEVCYDLNFAVLASQFSYSCGNLLPAVIRNEGVPILGGTSGGGSCMEIKHYFADGLSFPMSGGHAFVVGDSDVDAGIKPDCELVTYTEEGIPSCMDYYDFDKIESFINEFYGSGPADDSSEPEESQPDESSRKEDSSPATGAAGLIPLCAVVTAAAAMLFTRRICKKQ